MGIEIGIPYPIPRIRPQLQVGLPTDGNNCAFEVCRGHIIWALHNGTVPSIRRMRQIVNVPTAGINIAQARDIYLAYGLTVRFVRQDADVIAALTDPMNAVHLAVQYGWINDNAGHLSGDPKFRGGHATSAYGAEQVVDSGADWTLYGDPLHDGRRPNIPKGPMMARINVLLSAGHAMPSGLQALIIKRVP